RPCSRPIAWSSLWMTGVTRRKSLAAMRASAVQLGCKFAARGDGKVGAEAARSCGPPYCTVVAVMSAAAERRIPSLDGLRAISITLVLVSHLAGTRNFPLSATTGNFLGLGEFGVIVFFVISGFLITGLLLDELARTDRIRLGRFYFRRTLRIFPPYYMLIAVLAVAGAAGVIQLAPHDVARTMTYTSNYYAGRSWFVGHTWSLSVEEQFYLLWPAVLLLAGTRRAFVIAGAVVLLAPVVRVGEWELL